MAIYKAIIADITRRLAVLETHVLGGSVVEQPVDAASDRRLFKGEVAERRGKSTRAIPRDIAKKLMPPPDGIENNRPWWWLSSLQKHERQQRDAQTPQIARQPPSIGRSHTKPDHKSRPPPIAAPKRRGRPPKHAAHLRGDYTTTSA
jgi:hypothetical protein